MSPEASTIGGDQSLEELRRELTEAREQQAATAEILRALSSSPTDPQRVFQEIAASAARLCDAYDAVIRRVDGEVLRLIAHHGPMPLSDMLPLTRSSPGGRAVLDRQTIHVADTQLQTGDYRIDIARRLGLRTILAVPLIGAGEAIGVINIRRTEVRPFTDRQIALLETFANQAVIAIENARLFEAEQTRSRELTERTQELTETLEYLTATSEVLGVISRSPTNLQPVFDAIAQAAARLCKAHFCHVCRFDGKLLHFAAAYGLTLEGRQALQAGYPLPPGRATAAARAILSASVEEVPDVHIDLDYAHGGAATVMELRSVVAVPMVKDNHPIGAIAVARSTTGRFPARQIDLLKTFADQAVIAIENARLFEAEQARMCELSERTQELTESLEYQTASSEILGVISSSPTDIQPTFDAIAVSARRLCEAAHGMVFRFDGELIHLVAHDNLDSEQLAAVRSVFPIPPGRGSITARAILTRTLVHVQDRSQDPELDHIILSANFPTTLSVPLLRDGVALGAITVTRAEVALFSDRQIDLLKTFADQAVIAIENTRLFEAEQARTKELSDRTQELAQALEHQTATNDVLSVISRSPNLLQPVLDAIVRTAQRLCKSDRAQFFRLEDGRYHLAADQGTNASFLRFLADHPITPEPRSGSVTGRAAWERRTIHVPDTSANRDLALGDLDRPGRGRSVLAVPLLRDYLAIGVITLARDLLEPFTHKQIELIETFASQALIAIENARLFNEIAQKSRELEIASQHKSQFVANMSHELRTPLAAMLGYAELLQEGIYGGLPEKSLPILTRVCTNGKHLLGLINTVLDISKIEAGQFKLNLGEYALGSIVETVMVATESLAATKKLVFKTEVAKGLPYGLWDEQRLTQVLLNLVGNAIKFTDTGEVRVTAGAAIDHFSVSVSDTGPGIPAEECERIFEKFRQLDSSNTRTKGGTGLGLAIAREIVEMHGGRIWVESTVGAGSTFRIELPVRATSAASAA